MNNLIILGCLHLSLTSLLRQFHYVTPVGFELMIFWPQLPQWWKDKYAPPHLVPDI